MSAWLRRSSGERGAVSVELVTLAPVLIMAMWLVGVFALRLMLADAQVDSAARDAARAASIARSPRTARVAAATAATVALTGSRPQCRKVDAVTDTAQFGPGGMVRVSVRCTLRLADLGLLGFRTTRTVSASYLAPVDEFRGAFLRFGDFQESLAANSEVVSTDG